MGLKCITLQVFDFTLDDNEVATLSALDKGLEGQIFDMKDFEG